ncbi:BTAD domain-containing putative transcriptional regulator [Amycolatopsis sp. WGS_07]|uniref:AfsR/SARP family transcriptional regulator n=1 Tax=Amycolatopsis sp. WGS_07 TaxID=3076764 RepID=UPI003873667D
MIRHAGAVIGGDESGPALRFAVLGPVRAWYGDQPVALGPVRQQAVLAVLLLDRDRARTADDLLRTIWGGAPPSSKTNLVSVYLYRLRAAFRAAGVPGEVISSGPAGYRFVADAYLDAAHLDELLEASCADDAEAALTQATALLGGEPLAGLPGDHAAAERERLANRGLTAWRQLTELWIRENRLTPAIDALTKLVAAHPHDEPLVALLMRARYRGGWTSDALRDYRDLRRRLITDLGVEPSHTLRMLHEAILRDDASAVETPRRNELPPDISNFAGRDAVVDAIAASLAPRPGDAPRLAAVDGIAGVGKSAVVVHLAHRLHPAYPDGALFLDLHGYTAGRTPLSPSDALGRLLRTVGVADREVPDDLDERAAVWRARTADARLLLVLDNAASAEQVRLLLPGGSGNAVLVSSRGRLAGLDPDSQFTLDALPEAVAVELLTALINDTRAFAEPAEVSAVARLCGGLPLALRIVAARMRSRPQWTFAHLAARLSERRLHELADGPRSIEAAFSLSFQRLSPAEQRVFRLLGEIPGVALDRHCVAALAAIPATEAEELLENIVDASLLDLVALDRYRLHDLATDYARRLAAETPDPQALDRVLAYYEAAARDAHAQLTGDGDLPSANAWLTANRVALVELVEYAVANDRLDAAARIATVVAELFTMHAWFSDARRIHECVLAAGPDDDAPLWMNLAHVHGMRGAYQQAWDCFIRAEKGFSRSGDEKGVTRALAGLGAAARALGRYREAAGYLERALAEANRLEYSTPMFTVLPNLAMVHEQNGRYDLALEHARTAVELAAELGDSRRHCAMLGHLGELLRDSGDLAEAAQVLTDTVELAQRTGNVRVHAQALTELGAVSLRQGDPDTAIRHQLAALDMVDADALETMIMLRTHLGEAYLAARRAADAATQFTTVLTLTDRAPNPVARTRALAGLSRCS